MIMSVFRGICSSQLGLAYGDARRAYEPICFTAKRYTALAGGHRRAKRGMAWALA